MCRSAVGRHRQSQSGNSRSRALRRNTRAAASGAAPASQRATPAHLRQARKLGSRDGRLLTHCRQRGIACGRDELEDTFLLPFLLLCIASMQSRVH